MATKVSLINMKGGVGKSTLCVNLAWHFAAYSHWQKRVLVVDLDPQFNASQYMLGRLEYQGLLKKGTPTIWEVFEQNTKSPAGSVKAMAPTDPIHTVNTYRGGGRLDLVASRLELSYSLKNPAGKEKKLARLISAVEKDYDLVLIDCAPTESVLTEAAYLASDYLLVPVKPEYLSTIGLPLLAQSLNEFKAENPTSKLELAGIVFNSSTDYYPEENLSKKEVRKLAAQHGWHVFQSGVTYSKSFPKGAREGKPIFGTSYARSAKIDDFNRVATEFAKRVGL